MSLYINIDKNVIEACEKYKNGSIDLIALTQVCFMSAENISSIEDKDLKDIMECFSSEVEFAGPSNAQTIALLNIDKIEKLIIRSTTEGEPITESERAEWWKKQKAREREEFYNLNGYYEDDDPDNT